MLVGVTICFDCEVDIKVYLKDERGRGIMRAYDRKERVEKSGERERQRK